VELEICTGKYQYCDPSVVDGTGKYKNSCCPDSYIGIFVADI